MAEIDNKQTGHCSGNCMKCSPFQRAYCSSQLAYSNMRMLELVEQNMEAMQGQVAKLAEKIEAMQNNEADIFAPNLVATPMSPANITQEGVGVKE